MAKDISDYDIEIKNEIDDLLRLGIESNEKLISHDLTVASFVSDYIIKPVLIELENKQKSIDVLIDILKFVIPINFTLLITSLSITALSKALIWLWVIFIVLLSLLLFIIYKRYKLTEKYIRIYKETHEFLTNNFQENTNKNLTRVNKGMAMSFNHHVKDIKEMINDWNKKIDEFKKEHTIK